MILMCHPLITWVEYILPMFTVQSTHLSNVNIKIINSIGYQKD